MGRFLGPNSQCSEVGEHSFPQDCCKAGTHSSPTWPWLLDLRRQLPLLLVQVLLWGLLVLPALSSMMARSTLIFGLGLTHCTGGSVHSLSLPMVLSSKMQR